MLDEEAKKEKEKCVMYNRRFASLVLACFISVSFYLPAVLALDIVVEDIEISDFASECAMDVMVAEVGLTTDPPTVYATNRDYTIATLTPEFEGATFIMTSMDGASADCMTFTVDVPVIVWVTSDKRNEGYVSPLLTEENGWTMQSDGTEDADIIIETVEGDTNIFVVRAKEFAAGEVVVGTFGIGGPILVTRGGGGTSAVEGTDKLSTTWAELKSK